MTRRELKNVNVYKPQDLTKAIFCFIHIIMDILKINWKCINFGLFNVLIIKLILVSILVVIKQIKSVYCNTSDVFDVYC